MSTETEKYLDNVIETLYSENEKLKKDNADCLESIKISTELLFDMSVEKQKLIDILKESHDCIVNDMGYKKEQKRITKSIKELLK